MEPWQVVGRYDFDSCAFILSTGKLPAGLILTAVYTYIEYGQVAGRSDFDSCLNLYGAWASSLQV